MVWLIAYAAVGAAFGLVATIMWSENDGVGVCFVHGFMGMCVAVAWPLAAVAGMFCLLAALGKTAVRQ